jgi:DNA-binding response OmpR family regulator
MTDEERVCQLTGQWPGITDTEAIVLLELIKGNGATKRYDWLASVIFDARAFRPSMDTIRRAVSRLRKHGHVIDVVHGLGYRLVRLAPDSGST